MSIVLTFDRGNRIAQADMLLSQADGDVAPEAGQVTVAELYSGTTLVQRVLGPGRTLVLTPPADGIYRIEVYSERDGLQSWQRWVREVRVQAGVIATQYRRVTESGDPRVTESGDSRVTE